MILAVGLLALGGQAAAVTTAYTSQSGFEAAFDDGFALVNFDALGGLPAGYRLDDAAPAAALAALGVDSVGANALVVGGQDYQTPGVRDRLVLNGSTFNGAATPFIAFDFATGVNGVGAWANFGDGGRIRIYSDVGLTGTLLGETTFGKYAAGAQDLFGGITSTTAIRSVQFTCDYNGDAACGVLDLQFGRFASAEVGVVPEPSAWALMIAGFAGAGALLRRRRATVA